MLIHCPSCNTEYDCEPGKYECECGAKFSVSADGLLSIEDSASYEATSNEQTIELDIDKTIPPRQHGEAGSDVDATIPGKRDRKPDGRFEAGDLILGRYKVLSELGQGGMGVVYKCFDEVGGITIALKALPPELSHNTMEMEDVKENFQLVSRLVHQNIAISKNLEKDNTTGNYYLIMECVEGEDLRRWIRRKRKEGSLTVETILPVIRQVAAALDYAHEQKIIHRDIKPGNIMIDAAGHVKVLDFGLAAQIHTSMTRVSMAYHGTSGTAPYMAPEQWRGRAQGAAADQYALAVMTYEMLAGHLPFESTDASVLREAVLNETVDPIEGLPMSAQQTLARGMSKYPKERFNTCSDFVKILGGDEITEKKQIEEVHLFDNSVLIENKRKNKKRMKRNALISCGLALIIVFLAIIILAFTRGCTTTVYLKTDNGSGTTTKSGTSTKKVKLPKRIEEDIARGFRFSEDGRTLWKAPSSITNYDIPEEVSYIGDGAFKGCQLLKRITIPNSVKKIGKEAFSGCKSLSSITIPNGITMIEDGTFSYCSALSDISIPNSVTSIGAKDRPGIATNAVTRSLNYGSSIYNYKIHDGAFSNCTALTSITIPGSVEWIGDQTFSKCTALTSITIQEGVEGIGYGAFSYCTALNDIKIPNSVASTDDYVFGDCSSLRNVILSNRMSQIERSTFSKCEKLESITIPKGIYQIREYAFSDCTALKSITFPETLLSIHKYAFFNCKSLKSVSLPRETSISKNAFPGAGCENQVKKDYSHKMNVVD